MRPRVFIDSAYLRDQLRLVWVRTFCVRVPLAAGGTVVTGVPVRGSPDTVSVQERDLGICNKWVEDSVFSVLRMIFDNVSGASLSSYRSRVCHLWALRSGSTLSVRITDRIDRRLGAALTLHENMCNPVAYYSGGGPLSTDLTCCHLVNNHLMCYRGRFA